MNHNMLTCLRPAFTLVHLHRTLFWIAETRFILAPGETWKIPENALASGAHHWIFARGRGVILAGPSDHPMNPIQTVGAGATPLVSENLCIQNLSTLGDRRYWCCSWQVRHPPQLAIQHLTRIMNWNSIWTTIVSWSDIWFKAVRRESCDLSRYGARVVALTPVEAFRISCMDIQLATISDTPQN